VSINIKNKEAERLLAEIKARTGKGTSAVVLDLLRREHTRLTRAQEGEVARALQEMREFQQRWRSLPVIDPRPPEELVEYDENGLPV
jgi:antitoxin VapB